MHTFQINVLLEFLASSACFEHHVFIIRKTSCTCIFVWNVFHTEFTIKLYKVLVFYIFILKKKLSQIKVYHILYFYRYIKSLTFLYLDILCSFIVISG